MWLRNGICINRPTGLYIILGFVIPATPFWLVPALPAAGRRAGMTGLYSLVPNGTVPG